MDTLARIRLLTGDDPFWTSQNPTLLKGEVGFRNVEGDDPLMRVGDGVRAWNQLPDMNKVGPVGQIGPEGPVGPPGPIGPQGNPGDAQAPWRAPFDISDAQDNVLFHIDPEGFGQIGKMKWNEIGDIWMGGIEPHGESPLGNAVLNIYPEADKTGIYIHAGPNTRPTFAWLMYLESIDPNPGCSQGLMVKAGFTGQEAILYLQNSGSNQPCFRVNGDATGWIKTPAVGSTRITWNSTWFQIMRGDDVGVFAIRGSDGAVDFPNLIVSTAVLTANAYIWPDTTNGQLFRLTSSGRYKRDIESVRRERARELIGKLRVVSYRSNTELCTHDDPDATHYGLIAEEVARIDPALADYDDEGNPQSVNYNGIAMLLLPLVQEILGLAEPAATYG